ncbi:hypothetical protein [Reinekea sp.]|jgi:hypothetical protein|uniref:hypothetical protein n=1 Tax=Reinekea sp. TaxID=1970455 RepID=UPI003988E56F
MTKKHGPSYKKTKRPLKGCDDCKGTGLIKGVFHEMICFTCNGGGVVLKETGESLTADELVVELRLRLTERGDRIRVLESIIEGLKPYMEKKQAEALQESMYPKELMKQRAKYVNGGFGD